MFASPRPAPFGVLVVTADALRLVTDLVAELVPVIMSTAAAEAFAVAWKASKDFTLAIVRMTAKLIPLEQ